MSDLSIVTVTYQSAAKIDACLNAAQTAASSAEIVVVDNASTDGTRQVVKAAGANVRLVGTSENVGFGRGCNLGAEVARGAWLLFINPDVVLKTVTIPALTKDEGFGLGAGVIVSKDQHRGSPSVRAETTIAEDWIQEVWKLFIPRRLARYISVRRWPASWPVGGMFIARRDEYQRVGGFDPRYFLFFGDRDLGARYREQGLPVRMIDGLVGSHRPGTSSADVTSWHREAWSIVSWLEYVAVWRGADQAALTASRVLRVLTGIAHLANRANPSHRVRDRACRAGLVADFIVRFDEFLPSNAQSFYQCARIAVAAATDSASYKLTV